MLREEARSLHKESRPLMLTFVQVRPLANRPLLNVIWLIQLLILRAPSDLPKYLLFQIKCSLWLEIDFARQVPGVIWLPFER